MISDPTFGALCALGAALAWSVTSLLARSVIAHYGSATINAVRSCIAGTLLSSRREEERTFDELFVRSETGLGAEKADEPERVLAPH